MPASPGHPAFAPALLYLRHPCRRHGLRGPLTAILAFAALGLLPVALGLLPGGNAGAFFGAPPLGYLDMIPKVAAPTGTAGDRIARER